MHDGAPPGRAGTVSCRDPACAGGRRRGLQLQSLHAGTPASDRDGGCGESGGLCFRAERGKRRNVLCRQQAFTRARRDGAAAERHGRPRRGLSDLARELSGVFSQGRPGGGALRPRSDAFRAEDRTGAAHPAALCGQRAIFTADGALQRAHEAAAAAAWRRGAGASALSGYQRQPGAGMHPRRLHRPDQSHGAGDDICLSQKSLWSRCSLPVSGGLRVRPRFFRGMDARSFPLR